MERTFDLKLLGAGHLTPDERAQALQRFRESVVQTLGGDSQVADAYDAGERVLALYRPQLPPAGTARLAAVSRWKRACTKAQRAAFAKWPELETPEISFQVETRTVTGDPA